MASLRSAASGAPFIFVVGKGGVGKSTAAAAIALDLADAGATVHLISTDPAHSLSDVFRESFSGTPTLSSCSPCLHVEEFDAGARAAAWLEQATGPVTSILEAGTYLDAEDVAGFTRLALPGVDEMMAVLRLVELAGGDAGRPSDEGRKERPIVVVDTPPTGHALRLLDAASTHETLAVALRAMADKAAVVASSMAGRSIRLAGESFIDELHDCAAAFQRRVLARAAFIIAARPGEVVRRETERLGQALSGRDLRIAAEIWAGTAPAAAVTAARCFSVPLALDPRGCAGLRAWAAAVESVVQAPPAASDLAGASGGSARSVEPAAPTAPPAASAVGTSASGTHAAGTAPSGRAWVGSMPWRLIIVAGKGGVGKSSCAAAVAVTLSAQRDVLLCSTDPAGSLDDVFATPVTERGSAGPRLRVRQVDGSAHLEELRDGFRDEVEAALQRIGVGSSATLDRRVLDALWDLAPPGIDEFAALAALLDLAHSHETIVLDTAPTGHFLRLLTLPDIALDWTRQLMRMVVKYHAASGGIAESLLRTARELRHLRDLLRDPDAAAVMIVTLDEPVVSAETGRLQQALLDAGVHVGAVVVNRVAEAGARDRAGFVPGIRHEGRAPRGATAGTAANASTGTAVIRAPLLPLPPVGSEALREFVGTWKIEA
jgi:arsenite/tail-anchored protein-transporting ATPase